MITNSPFSSYVPLYIAHFIFLALLDFVSRATVMAQVPAIRRPSVNSDFSETTAWTEAKFCGKGTYPPNLQTFIFSFFKIYDFQIFTFFSVNKDPMGAKTSKRYFSHSFGPISAKLHDKFVSHSGI